MQDINDDPTVRKLLAKKDRVEGLNWLKGGGKFFNIGEMSHAQSLRFIESLYKLGAIEVTVANIVKNEPWVSTDTVLVELPSPGPKRIKLFSFANERAMEMGFDPESDRGQQHLLIWFD